MESERKIEKNDSESEMEVVENDKRQFLKCVPILVSNIKFDDYIAYPNNFNFLIVTADKKIESSENDFKLEESDLEQAVKVIEGNAVILYHKNRRGTTILDIMRPDVNNSVLDRLHALQNGAELYKPAKILESNNNQFTNNVFYRYKHEIGLEIKKHTLDQNESRAAVGEIELLDGKVYIMISDEVVGDVYLVTALASKTREHIQTNSASNLQVKIDPNIQYKSYKLFVEPYKVNCKETSHKGGIRFVRISRTRESGAEIVPFSKNNSTITNSQLNVLAKIPSELMRMELDYRQHSNLTVSESRRRMFFQLREKIPQKQQRGRGEKSNPTINTLRKRPQAFIITDEDYENDTVKKKLPKLRSLRTIMRKKIGIESDVYQKTLDVLKQCVVKSSEVQEIVEGFEKDLKSFEFKKPLN